MSNKVLSSELCLKIPQRNEKTELLSNTNKSGLIPQLIMKDTLCHNTFKSSLTVSPLLHDLKHIKARNCLLKIRLGVSQLRAHGLRFSRNAEADLACPFCNNEIESEIHFTLSCPLYNDLRDKYTPRK